MALEFLAIHYKELKQYEQAHHYAQKWLKVAPSGQKRDEANRLL